MKPAYTRAALVLLIVLVVYFYWRKANAARNLSFSFGLPQRFSFRDASLYFSVPIRVLNPSPESVRIAGINLQAYYGGSYLGTIYALQPQTIEALAESTVNADVFLPIVNIVNSIPELRTASKTIPITLTGNVRAFGVAFPINYVQSFTLPKL